jgi:hypothetical protein
LVQGYGSPVRIAGILVTEFDARGIVSTLVSDRRPQALLDRHV